MSLLHYDKIFVVAPYKYVSGGPELAHQLVDYLRNKGRKAYIVYVEPENNCEVVAQNPLITEQYQKYNISVSNNIEDNQNNVVVLPESFLICIPKFRKIQVCVWWMSVDNALAWNRNFIESFKHTCTLYDKLRMIRHIWWYKNNYSMKKLRHEDYRLIHFYQATNIQQFLYSQNLDHIVRLSDYINPEILNNVDASKEKENIILYNPSKGIRYTKKLIKQMPNYRFIALKGFDREQLNSLFDRAKLYIDFGPFPGKDRLPREAAIHNCCIITGKFGASKYFEDFPIYRKYKFDLLHANFSSIKNRINEIFDNYDKCQKDFQYMRESIRHEQGDFYREIDNIFL
jgi:hypothetical protein